MFLVLKPPKHIYSFLGTNSMAKVGPHISRLHCILGNKKESISQLEHTGIHYIDLFTLDRSPELIYRDTYCE